MVEVTEVITEIKFYVFKNNYQQKLLEFFQFANMSKNIKEI